MVIIPATWEYYRGIARGVAEYAHTKPWVVRLQQWIDAGVTRVADQWQPHGVIIDPDQGLSEWACKRRRPAVAISAAHATPLPSVGPDEPAIGRMAAQHFIDRGFRHFAAVGFPDKPFSNQRLDAFRLAIQGNAASFQIFGENDPNFMSLTLGRQMRLRRKWLTQLTRPVALFCTSDPLAMEVIEECRGEGLRVPEEVAVLGVDDDPMQCNLSWPPLSSIALPLREIGWTAASTLDRFMTNRTSHRDHHQYLKPLGVVARQSTNIYAVDDLDIRNALHYIRENLSSPLTTAEIVDAITSQRRTLERKFKTILGRTINEEIRRVRVERALALMTSTNLPMHEVAARCGFGNQSWMTSVVHQATGRTPREHRRHARLPQTPAHQEDKRGA